MQSKKIVKLETSFGRYQMGSQSMLGILNKRSDNIAILSHKSSEGPEQMGANICNAYSLMKNLEKGE